MGDINTYALGLEFQLQAAPAIETLNSIIDSTSDLQMALKAAAKAFDASRQIYDLQSVIDVQKDYASLIDAATFAEVQYREALKSGSISAALSVQQQEAYNERIRDAKRAYEEIIDATKEFRTEHEKYGDFLKIQDVRLNKHIKQIQQFEKVVASETELIKKQVQPYKDALTWLSKLSDQTSEFGSIITQLVGRYGPLGAVLTFLGMGFKDVMTMQDEYRLASMRAIGTQSELIQSTIQLSQTLGATTKESVQTIKALAGVGFKAADSVDKLADANFRFQKITGVAANTTARYQRTLNVMGLDAKQSTRVLSEMSSVMRNTGMTTAQLETIMGELSKTMMVLRLSFDARSVTDFAKALTAVSGAAQAAGADGDAIRAQLTTMSRDIYKNAAAWALFGVTVQHGMDIGVATEKVLSNMGPTIDQLTKNYKELTPTILAAYGVTEDAAAAMLAIQKAANAAGKSVTQFINDNKQAENFSKQFADATNTLTEQLKQLLMPLMKVASSLMAIVVPAMTTFLGIITPIITKLGEWWSYMQKELPPLAYLFNALVGALMVGAALKLVGGLKLITGAFSMIKSVATGAMGALKGTATVMQVASRTSLTAGTGVKAFLTNFAEGLKAMGNPAAFKGALTLGLLVAVVGGTLILMAMAMNKFGISAKDLIGAATAMVIVAGAIWILKFAIEAIGKSGPAGLKGALILIGVLLALGVATLMAGVGIGFMAKGFAELFKAIPDIQTFLVVIGGLLFAMPMLAIGIAGLGLSIMASAPFILMGFGMLFASAMLALVINPIFADFAKTIGSISTSLNAINPNMGMALLDLAAGITAFMFALMGIAAGGALSGIGSLFGVKSPLKQAEEIADAMRAIAEPASLLSGAVGRIATIGDVFKPFIDGILGRKDEIEAATSIIAKLAKQVESARKSIGSGIAPAFGPIIISAQPVRKPAITEDTARKIRDERNQSLLVNSSKETNESLLKAIDKMDKMDMHDLVTLLKEWLPKIAGGDDNSQGLSSSVTQWM